MRSIIILLGIILSFLFWKSFLPDYVIFSNDGPVGAMFMDCNRCSLPPRLNFIVRLFIIITISYWVLFYPDRLKLPAVNWKCLGKGILDIILVFPCLILAILNLEKDVK